MVIVFIQYTIIIFIFLLVIFMECFMCDKRPKIIAFLKKELERRKQSAYKYNWNYQARSEQLSPQGDWRIWLILAGRGFGKTRTGAETVREWVTQGICKRICLLGHTLEDVRRVMIEGESGLLSIFPQNERPIYKPSQRKIIFANQAVADVYSADAYAQLRGPQFDGAWIDELAKFSYAKAAWDQLMFGLRLGKLPRVVITTTPRPIALLSELMSRKDVVITRGSTFDNKENLSEKYIEELQQTYAGTRLGAQEIEGHLLTNQENALWKSDCFLYTKADELPILKRTVVAIDPAVTNNEHSDETGIVVAGYDEEGNGYVLADKSGKFSSTQWINQAVEAYHQWNADRIIAEVNNGGELVEQLLHTLHPSVPYKAVRATRGKYTRAEPVSALYEQKRIFHLQHFHELENQMLSYTPQSASSPDRLDALVWALTELFLSNVKPVKIWSY